MKRMGCDGSLFANLAFSLVISLSYLPFSELSMSFVCLISFLILPFISYS